MSDMTVEERAEALLRGREFGHYWEGEFCRSLEIGETLPLVVAAIHDAEQAAAAQAQVGVDALAEEIVALREDLEKARAEEREWMRDWAERMIAANQGTSPHAGGVRCTAEIMLDALSDRSTD